MTTLFISDLHLSSADPHLFTLFSSFLQREVCQASALYILGDLFEQWIGDDDPDELNAKVQAALLNVVEHGVPVFLMHGNRDFLLGQRFFKCSGCQSLPDPSIITVNDQRLLLMHGDTLCTDDEAYLRFRRKVRNPRIQWLFLHLPLWYRLRTARRYRAGSQKHKMTNKEIMDVSSTAVVEHMRQYQVRALIHGHTHRPALHCHSINGENGGRAVLAAWGKLGNALAIDPDGSWRMLFFDENATVKTQKVVIAHDDLRF